MNKQPVACPSCGGALIVSGLTCKACGTTIGGHFRNCEFCRLSEEQSTFLRLFVQRRGNLSEMEKALGISYPTVRNKLEEVIRALQEAQAEPPAPQPSPRDAILMQVADGSVTAEQALDLLAQLSQKGV